MTAYTRELFRHRFFFYFLSKLKIFSEDTWVTLNRSLWKWYQDNPKVQ